LPRSVAADRELHASVREQEPHNIERVRHRAGISGLARPVRDGVVPIPNIAVRAPVAAIETSTMADRKTNQLTKRVSDYVPVTFQNGTISKQGPGGVGAGPHGGVVGDSRRRLQLKHLGRTNNDFAVSPPFFIC
jgi:hypothetical protein